MISVQNIYKSFGEQVVLDNVSVEFEEGKTNLIIGASGSGKTVLLKAVAGLHTIDQGEIFTTPRNYLNKAQRSVKKFISRWGCCSRVLPCLILQRLVRTFVFLLIFHGLVTGGTKRTGRFLSGAGKFDRGA